MAQIYKAQSGALQMPLWSQLYTTTSINQSTKNLYSGY